MALKLVTPPTVEPLTMADVEAQTRADLTTESELVEGYISAVRARAEVELRRAILAQTWDLVLDAFPTSTARNPYAALEINLPPLQSITHIKYLSTDNVLTTLAASEYVVDLDSTPGRVTPAYGKVWPSTLDYPGAVRIRFVAGYGDEVMDVPQCIRHWMLMNVATLYENRESLTIGNGGVIELKTLADSLLDPERWEVRL